MDRKQIEGFWMSWFMMAGDGKFILVPGGRQTQK
jgi:hypothetical protein